MINSDHVPDKEIRSLTTIPPQYEQCLSVVFISPLQDLQFMILNVCQNRFNNMPTNIRMFLVIIQHNQKPNQFLDLDFTQQCGRERGRMILCMQLIIYSEFYPNVIGLAYRYILFLLSLHKKHHHPLKLEINHEYTSICLPNYYKSYRLG